MENVKRLPRIQIHENSFSEEIKNISIPKENIRNGSPEDFYVEVKNANGEVIALFYQLFQFDKRDFRDVMEYAKYYDSTGLAQLEDRDWKLFKEIRKLNDDTTKEEMLLMDEFYDFLGEREDYHKYGYANDMFISYGRFKYPLGLDEDHREEYLAEIINWDAYDGIYEYTFQGNEDISDDLIDVINFALGLRIGTEEYNIQENFIRHNPYCIKMGIKIISGIADNLFTKENINQFIDQANTDRETEILAFLLDYKNKHFPTDGGYSPELTI